ncbi:hypothetical protein KAR91_08730 [Candidatus Pacearchaeota archaeon]|nr:hypothetical protein [Candidatus Pacearchaeota archaeon]
MKKVGIVLDGWKLPIFKKHLDAEGYDYTQQDGLGKFKGCIILKVETSDVEKLAVLTKKMNQEAARSKN